MKKLLLMFLALFTTIGTWATVTQPTVTTDPSNPVYYRIGSYNRGGYLTYNGSSSNLTHVDACAASLWYFVENGEGVSLVPAVEPTVKMATINSATATGAVWYLVENPYNEGYFCISLTSDLSSQCIDANNWSTGTGTWKPSSTDFAGVSWTIEEVTDAPADPAAAWLEETKATYLTSVEGFTTMLPAIYTDDDVTTAKAAINGANSVYELRSMTLPALDKYITLENKNYSGYYLNIGASSASRSTDATNSVIRLAANADGTFYMQGYASKSYLGNVTTSQAVPATTSPSVKFVGKTNSDGYVGVRPASTGESSYNYVHFGGSGVVGWEFNADATLFTISEVDVPITFSYVVRQGGVEIYRETANANIGDVITAFPSSLERDYTTLTYPVSSYTITDADDQEFVADATFDLPFVPFTEYDNATWYYARIRGNYYILYDENNEPYYPTASPDKYNFGYQWAFSGNPYSGFSIYNKKAGDGMVLTKDGNYAVMRTSSTETWQLIKNGDNGFNLLRVGSTQDYINQNGGTTGPLGFWISSYGRTDNGGKWVLEIAPTDEELMQEAYVAYLEQLAAINWGTGVHQYTLPGHEGSELAYINSLQEAGFSIDNYNIVLNLIESYSLNLPAAGFYRIKGNTSGLYLASGFASNSKFNMTDATDASTIFYFDGTKLINYGSGMCNGTTGSGSWSWTVYESASAVEFMDGNTNGGYGIKTGTGYFYDNGDNTASADRGASVNMSTDNVRYRSWYLTEVTSLPVETTAEGYTSFSAPVPVTIPANNCYAYIATGEETGVVNMTKVTGDVAANTGLIISTNGIEVVGPLSFDVAESGTAYTDNLLVANVAAANVSKANNYFFGKVGDDYVFTLLSGDDDYTLRGYKAYLNLSGSAARLSINWGGDDATGLSELSNEIIKLNDGKYYQNGRVIVVRNGIKYNVAGQTIK